MAEELTLQQKAAVYDRGGKLLVSAAAGSGKTKVLVDRILSYLKDPVSPANLDDFLVITYTKAAASELRGKIAGKLSQEIAADPDNRHLQRQMQRLYLAKISTVHAYCSDILRENAYQLDIPADFRVSEDNESEEMQRIAIDKVLNDAYKNIHNNADISAFVDTQGFGRNDRQLPEIILKLYNNSRCHMDPDAWLSWCVDVFASAETADISNTPWAEYLINDLHHYLDLQIDALNNCVDRAKNAEGLSNSKPVALFCDTISQLERLRSCTRWDDIITNANIAFGTLTFPRKNYDADVAAHMKAVRSSCKDGVAKKLRRFTDCGDQILSDVAVTAAAARGLVALTRQFSSEYDKMKKRARVLDFSDLEQKTLDLLLGKRRYGPTTFAAEIGQRFREVMVDEYQDSNEVQDAIFSAITEKRQNCFMVGDVKQSIYQFRRADPEIFFKKYNTYAPAELAQSGEGRRVLLTSNFRSGEGVINAVNDVFTECMSKHVGGLDYGKDEMLYEGIPHEPLGDTEVELYGIIAEDDAYDKEASFVAQRVLELLDGKHMIREKNSMRPIFPGDIAILLRSPGSIGIRYVQALERVGVRCCIGNSANLLETEEVQTLRGILQVLDNPLQDIPLISVLTSKLFGFTADDLTVIRCAKRNSCIFDALQVDTSDKSKQFISLFRSLRAKARTSTLLGLIKYIFTLTKLDSVFSAMSDGDNRMENLLGFYKIAADFDARGGKSLGVFLSRLDSLEQKGIAVDAESISTDAVTITSIHKSKGLEYPVVILPGLSRKFNNESAYDNLLCDKDLGIGLSCVDIKNRVRYPSVSKHAISAKILSEGMSEEMRVLYVAMTRARDRLIMTFTSRTLEKKLHDIALRMEYSAPELLTGEVSSPGEWILISAMRRMDAGAFFAISAQPQNLITSKTPWKIKIIDDTIAVQVARQVEYIGEKTLPLNAENRIKRTLRFSYPHIAATTTPSKQTATQIKGREKDMEVVESTGNRIDYAKEFRIPTFVENRDAAFKRGNAFHAVMQYINYAECTDIISVTREIERLVVEGYIEKEQATLVDPSKIVTFFKTDLGKKLNCGKEVLREFKFSILEDAAKYDSTVNGEEILLQGVVDCALLEEDGITVLDFKTDKIKEENVPTTAMHYSPQVSAYANALERIYHKPIKTVALYFFEPEITVIM